jgi:hypothetical protein
MTVILSKLNLNEEESSKSKKSMEPAEETECDGLNVGIYTTSILLL